MPQTVLLATDNLKVVGMFKRIAEEHALNIEMVSSVSDAVMAFVQSMHDLVFLSPGLEGGRGMHLVKELASLSPRIVLLGEAREGFEHLELPLVESKVLVCLGLEEEEAKPPKLAHVFYFDAKKPPPPSEKKAEATAEAPAPVEEILEAEILEEEEASLIEKTPPVAEAKRGSEGIFRGSEEVFRKSEHVFRGSQSVFRRREEVSQRNEEASQRSEEASQRNADAFRKKEDAFHEEAKLLKAKISDLSEQLARMSEEKAQAESKLLSTEEALAKLEEKLQVHRRLHGKLEAELEKNRAELLELKAQKEEASQAKQELESRWGLFQKEQEHAREEFKKGELLLERALEERERWQENKSELSLEIQQMKEKLARMQEEKDMACLQLAEVSEKWQKSEACLQSALSSAAFSQAEQEALWARAQKAEVALEARNAEFEEQVLASQKRIARMEEELVQLRSQVVASEAEARAALAMAPATLILPLSAPMPGNVFSSLEECLQLLVQTAATRPWLRLDIESRLGRRKLYICQGALMGVDSNCPGDLFLKQAQRDGLIDSKQYQSLRLLEERSPNEQLEVLLRKGFIREAEVEGLLQRYAERVLLEAMSQKEAAFALVEEKPGAEATVLKKSQPLWPLLKEGMARRHAEAHFLERFGGMEAVPILKTNLSGLVAMGMSKTEMRFFESIDAETQLEELVEDLGFHPKQMFFMLLTAWKLGVIEFSKKKFMHAGTSELNIKRLFARFEEIRDADYFGVLGVSQEASTPELKDAHMRLMEEFNPLKFAGHADPKVFACAKQLTALVEEAFWVLENETQRKEYAQNLMGARS